MFTRLPPIVLPTMGAIRRTAVGVVLAGLVVAGCGGPSEIRTVADFDAAPCGLFTQDAMRQIVTEPFRNLVGSEPKITDEPAEAAQAETFACVYRFEPTRSPRVPQVTTLTVTVAHAKTGSQPLAICAAGAASNSPGYKMQPLADQACLSPSSDLWMRIGEHFHHVVVVPQPGFANPVDMFLALSPLILAVGQATAGRMPKS